jgi:uncharacterized membrane protein
MGQLRKYFLSGIAVSLPIGLTVLVFWFLVSRLGGIFRPLLSGSVWLARLPNWLETVAGFLFLLIIVLAVGALASSLFGRWFVARVDNLMRRLPMVRAVYGSAREMTNAVFVRRSSLRKTVLAEYPRPGFWALGFLTSDDRVPLPDGRQALFVFFPTTPNPTSGWLALIPEAEVTEIGVSINDGLKLIVSGGVLRPESFERWTAGRKA